MATIYRAYHTRADFEKYKFVTLHVTLLLVLTGIVMHASPRFFPWLFTLYICWSPWHYSGAELRSINDVRAAQRRGNHRRREALAARRVCGVVPDAAREL